MQSRCELPSTLLKRLCIFGPKDAIQIRYYYYYYYYNSDFRYSLLRCNVVFNFFFNFSCFQLIMIVFATMNQW